MLSNLDSQMKVEALATLICTVITVLICGFRSWQFYFKKFSARDSFSKKGKTIHSIMATALMVYIANMISWNIILSIQINPDSNTTMLGIITGVVGSFAGFLMSCFLLRNPKIESKPFKPET